ncbi:hypothetical protein AAHC03_09533 [Spirometra sp. Aus1]
MTDVIHRIHLRKSIEDSYAYYGEAGQYTSVVRDPGSRIDGSSAIRADPFPPSGGAIQMSMRVEKKSAVSLSPDFLNQPSCSSLILSRTNLRHTKNPTLLVLFPLLAFSQLRGAGVGFRHCYR